MFNKPNWWQIIVISGRFPREWLGVVPLFTDDQGTIQSLEVRRQ